MLPKTLQSESCCCAVTVCMNKGLICFFFRAETLAFSRPNELHHNYKWLINIRSKIKQNTIIAIVMRKTLNMDGTFKVLRNSIEFEIMLKRRFIFWFTKLLNWYEYDCQEPKPLYTLHRFWNAIKWRFTLTKMIEPDW